MTPHAPRLVPTVKITLQHVTGAVSSYKAGIDPANEFAGGIKEAIITCSLGAPGDLRSRIELLRADVPGADWTALQRAGGVAEFVQRLTRAANDLLDGHNPHIVVTLGDKGSFGDARLVTDASQVESELKANSAKRSLVVPRLLPYQMGGDAAGSVAVIFKPAAGGGLRVHSMHPTVHEAVVAEKALQASGEAATATMRISTAVTALLQDVASGQFKPATVLQAAAALVSGEGDEGAGGRAKNPTTGPGLSRSSPLSTRGAPSPFATA